MFVFHHDLVEVCTSCKSNILQTFFSEVQSLRYEKRAEQYQNMPGSSDDKSHQWYVDIFYDSSIVMKQYEITMKC